MEIRTRKVVRRCVSGDGERTCKRPRFYNRSEYYSRRYAQYKRAEKSYSPTYRIVETREPLRPRASINTLWRRSPSSIRSQPFEMRLPFIKRVAVPAKDDYEPIPRGQSRSPRLFVVDSPQEIRYARPNSERSISLSPEIRCISPRRMPSAPPLRREMIEVSDERVVLDNIPREGRPLERRKGPRPPRERTPVVEREPMRRRRHQNPARVVEIHQSPEQKKERSRSSEQRQVRFSEEIEFEENRNRSRERYEPHQPERVDGSPEEIRRRVFERRMPEEIEDRPRCRRLSPERAACRRDSAPWRNWREDTVRADAISERGRLRPRIIQYGDRDLSEAGERIYAEARRRRSQERRAFHNLISHSSSRWRRCVDDMREFSSEDESLLRDRVSPRRYGWRWR